MATDYVTYSVVIFVIAMMLYAISRIYRTIMCKVTRYSCNDTHDIVTFVHRDKKMTIMRLGCGEWSREIASIGRQSHQVYPQAILRYYSAPFEPGDYFLPIPLSHRRAKLYSHAIEKFVQSKGIVLPEGCPAH